MRWSLRRFLARRLRARCRNVWPINEAAASVPAAWKGWPEGKQFAFVLTHDVEAQVGLDRCRDLMRADMQFGFRSCFNFVPEGDYSVPSSLRDELGANGFEVGIHDLKHNGKLFRSKAEFNRHATIINQYLRQWGAVGFRAAFMLRNLDWISELDIEYDASTFDTDPFEPQPDGVGTIFPFWVPRRSSEPGPQHSTLDTQHSRKGYIELPYTLPQDSTVFMLLREETPDIWCRKLDWVAEHGGMALLTTHPDYMAFNRQASRPLEYSANLYTEFLQYVASKFTGAYWHALPREVAAHFKNVSLPGILPRESTMAKVAAAI
jgi:hypothetical protein